LHSLGLDAQRLGNIGQPPYDPSVDTSAGWLVLEVSSFQAVDVDVAPATIVITSLGDDHVDWHGSLEQYRSDKLSLTRAAGEHHTFVADSATLHELESQMGGHVEFVSPDHSGLAVALGLIGAHNDSNVALALRAVTSLTGHDPTTLRDTVASVADRFEPLRGRLTLIATEVVDGSVVRYVDDGLATSVLPAVAALEVFADEAVALIAGGFDRGVEYAPLADAIAARRQPTTLITSGNAGLRISDEVHQRRKDLVQHTAASMQEAVQLARAALEHGGVVLLSPAAPSFDRYRNWEERSADFTAIVRSLVS
jgi:UDP-N-acetylmuramoylalanine-D-glutamate ligase